MEKMRVLVGIHYHLYRNRTNYLKILQTGGIFLDLNPNEIYNMTTSVLELILLIVSCQKLANLLHL